MDDPRGWSAETSLRDHGLILAVAGAASVAAASLLLLGRSPYGWLLHHGEISTAGDAPLPIRVLLLMAAWVLMVIAMMLPTAVPLLEALRRVVARRPDRRRLLAIASVGFLSTWTAFGGLLLIGNELVHPVVAEADSLLPGRPHLAGAIALAGAGFYQLSTLKTRCLQRCRSPQGFLYRHWNGGAGPGARSLQIGAMYGLSCVGCCWALMLVMFALGAANLAWMVVFGAVMAFEKNSAAGVRLRGPIGVELILLAALLLANSIYSHHTL
jgi:predicted metal-binding membrane protein